MIATIELAKVLAAFVKAHVKSGNAPLFGEVRALGRKLKNGPVTIIGSEVYAGPEGHAAPYAYIRFRDGAQEHTFTPVRGYDGSPHVEVVALLRLVAVHRCKNEGALQTAVIASLLQAGVKASQFKVRLLSASGRGQTIQKDEVAGDEERKDDNDFLGEAMLMAVDFNLIYTLSADEADCNFDCDGCC